MTPNGLKRFWRAFRSDMEKHRASQLLSGKKARKKREKSGMCVPENLSPVIVNVGKEDYEKNIKNSSEIHQNNRPDDVQKSVENTTKNNIFVSQSSAHFIMPPDTEDL